jgi:hypothetical protein
MSSTDIDSSPEKEYKGRFKQMENGKGSLNLIQKLVNDYPQLF